MKPLYPSHREKKRYLLVAGKDASKENIEKAVLDFLGILGYAEASPQIVKQGKGKVIIAINRKSLDKVKASLLLSGKELRVARVSGSLKKLK